MTLDTTSEAITREILWTVDNAMYRWSPWQIARADPVRSAHSWARTEELVNAALSEP